jgi:hypothetical protein
MSDQDKLDRDEQKVRFGEMARQVKENTAYQSAWAVRRGELVQELVVLKKGKHYEAKLKDIHDSLQNLDRLEAQINRYYETGKKEVSKRKGLFNRDI